MDTKQLPTVNQRTIKAVIIICGVIIAVILTLSPTSFASNHDNVFTETDELSLFENPGEKEVEEVETQKVYSAYLYKLFVRNLPYLNNK